MSLGANEILAEQARQLFQPALVSNLVQIGVAAIDEAMVRSINEIGHVIGMKTVAEFVENDAIKERLKEMGVDYVQGYGIGKPVPLESITLR